jgi:hypothetical protein
MQQSPRRLSQGRTIGRAFHFHFLRGGHSGSGGTSSRLVSLMRLLHHGGHVVAGGATAVVHQRGKRRWGRSKLGGFRQFVCCCHVESECSLSTSGSCGGIDELIMFRHPPWSGGLFCPDSFIQFPDPSLVSRALLLPSPNSIVYVLLSAVFDS